MDQAFADLGDRSVPLSVAVAKAKRIARLRGDFENLHWIELELRAFGDDFKNTEIAREISSHYSANEAKHRNQEVIDRYIAERTEDLPGDDDKLETKMLAFSLREMEDRLRQIDEMESRLNDRTREQVMGTSAKMRMAIHRVLGRIEHRVHEFLSATETQLLYGQVNADIFERNRRYVDGELADFSPRCLEQLSSAYQRALEGNEEARSQALLSCRRALKSIADLLCPATDAVAVDESGQSHALTDDKWRNRLTEFVKSKLQGHSAGEVLETQLDDLARRFRGLGEASSRGVHANVTEFELNQAVIQTYLTIGDLLRLRADDSGLTALVQGFASSP